MKQLYFQPKEPKIQQINSIDETIPENKDLLFLPEYMFFKATTNGIDIVANYNAPKPDYSEFIERFLAAKTVDEQCAMISEEYYYKSEFQAKFQIIMKLYKDNLFCPPPVNAKKRQVIRKNVPKVMREQLWHSHFGDSSSGKCYVCRANKIHILSFHCGHVISVADGGATTLENLRPICQACNLDMGTENLEEFKNKYYPNNKQNQ